MCAFRSRFMKLVSVMAFLGWITYPGWFTEWYSTWPEQVRISGEHVYPSRSKVGILVPVILTLGVHLPFSNPFS